MSDDDKLTQTPTPLPESYFIPRPAIDHWLAIPVDAYIQGSLTRRDWDKFFESYDKMLQAQFVFQESMVAYTNGNLDAANVDYNRARALLVESQNAFRMMFTSLMMSAAARNE